MDSIPNGTEPLSHAQAVEALLEVKDENTPEEVSEESEEIQEQPEVQEEEVEATDEGQAEAETDEQTEEVEETNEEEVLYSVKVDGEEYSVNESELIESYQLKQTAHKRLQEAAESRKANEAKEAALEQERVKYAAVLQQMEQNLNQPAMSEVELEKLKDRDPMAYYEAKDQIRDQKEKLAAVQQEQQVVKSQHLATQHSRLLELIPEWKNQEIAEKEKVGLANYLQTNGFSKEDIGNATDARIVNLARKAQLYDNLQSKKAVVKKKVTAAPKMIKSGQPKGKIDVKQKAKDDAWKNLQKVGSKEAAVNYLLNK